MESILTGVSVTLDMLVASVTPIMMIVVLLLVPMVSNTKLLRCSVMGLSVNFSLAGEKAIQSINFHI